MPRAPGLHKGQDHRAVGRLYSKQVFAKRSANILASWGAFSQVAVLFPSCWSMLKAGVWWSWCYCSRQVSCPLWRKTEHIFIEISQSLLSSQGCSTSQNMVPAKTMITGYSRPLQTLSLPNQDMSSIKQQLTAIYWQTHILVSTHHMRLSTSPSSHIF